MSTLKFIVDENITLKQLSQKEVKPIFEIVNEEREYLGEWLPFVEYTLQIADTQQFVNSVILLETKDLNFAIYHLNRFVGIISLKDPDSDNKKVELGYWISEKYQHKGIITKSALKLIQYAFNELEMNRIQLRTAVRNIKSQQVAKRLGFTFERIEREGELLNHYFVDLNVYSLLKREFDNLY